WLVSSVAPQPFAVRTTIRLTRARSAVSAAAPAGAESWRLTIYDAAGRRVRTLVASATAPAEEAAAQQFVWDGRDEGGRGLAAGIYPFQFEADGERVSGRLVRLEGGR